jgi:hypothetical protein
MRGRSTALAATMACAVAAAWTAGSHAEDPPRQARLYVTSAASALVAEGLADAAPADAAGFEEVPPPGVRFVPTVARSTNVPWVDSNGWRFQRGLRQARYAELPAGAAALAAAEAFAYGVEAILEPDTADIEELRAMLRFLRTEKRPPLPLRANISVVDDGSEPLGEVLKMLSRRNLLYRVVTKPDPAADLTVRLGTPEFPEEEAADPYQFAQLVRERLGDDRRLLRLYGVSTVLARFTGDGGAARLYLLSYARPGRQPSDNPQAMQVRVLGRYEPQAFAGYGAAPNAALSDLRHPDGATEFWVPSFRSLAIVDLVAVK